MQVVPRKSCGGCAKLYIRNITASALLAYFSELDKKRLKVTAPMLSHFHPVCHLLILYLRSLVCSLLAILNMLPTQLTRCVFRDRRISSRCTLLICSGLYIRYLHREESHHRHSPSRRPFVSPRVYTELCGTCFN